MPAPSVRRASARSCTRTRQPRCTSAQAAERPANPAPRISARRSVLMRRSVEVEANYCLAGCGRATIMSENRRATMAKLRHFALAVKDLEKSAAFYESVFGLKRVGREDLDIGSGIYLSDGVINLALLSFKGDRGSGWKDAKSFVGAHHFGFQVDDLADTQQRIESAGGTFFFDLGEGKDKVNFERKFKDPEGIIFDISEKGWL